MYFEWEKNDFEIYVQEILYFFMEAAHLWNSFAMLCSK